MRLLLILCALMGALAGLAPVVAAAQPVTVGEYRFKGISDPLVLTDRKIDLWAAVYRPVTLGTGPHPLLVFLHGNHGTCGRYDPVLKVRVDDAAEYTETGVCPSGYTVTPNHLGYGYLARRLASYGYIVVSINANRGITAGFGTPDDWGLNLARGRLVLRHLALLSDWNRGIGVRKPPASLGFDPKGTMDFSEVGLFGHSRGGEGVRAALAQWRDAASPFPARIGPMTIRSLFEIGPVDGQTSRVLDANGVASMILLPGCDGDVSDLQGVHVFDRVFGRTDDAVRAFHGTLFVAGANHNAYNSEWLTSDTSSCAGAAPLYPDAGRSPSQQATAAGSVVPFFRATVGAAKRPALAAVFDPAVPLPASLTAITTITRGYLPAPIGKDVRILEDFSGVGAVSRAGVPYLVKNLSVTNQPGPSEHDQSVPTYRATVTWTGTQPEPRYFQLRLAKTGGIDLSADSTLALRVVIDCVIAPCRSPEDLPADMAFKVALVTAAGSVSKPLSTEGRIRLSPPSGAYGDYHTVFATLELPLSEFGVALGRIAAVRFIFDSRASGRVYLGTITASPLPVAAAPAGIAVAGGTAPARPVGTSASAPTPQAIGPEVGDAIRVIAPAPGPAATAAAGQPVTIELTSLTPFPIGDALPSLVVGGRTFRTAAVVGDGRTVRATLPAADAAALAGAPVGLRTSPAAPLRQFGPLPGR